MGKWALLVRDDGWAYQLTFPTVSKVEEAIGLANLRKYLEMSKNKNKNISLVKETSVFSD